MPKGKIITIVLAIATILVIIAFIDSCHDTSDLPPEYTQSHVGPSTSLDLQDPPRAASSEAARIPL